MAITVGSPPQRAPTFAALALLILSLGTAGSVRLAHAAGMVVNTLADANPPSADALCSLREAITNANTNAATYPDCPAGTGADTIIFSVSGTIVLAAALPDITDPAGLTIDGSGQSVTVSGNNAVRPLTNALAAALTIRRLTVSHGSGGGILNSGRLTLTDSTVNGNILGGIANAGTGTLAIINSTITGNTKAFQGGGIDNGGSLLVIASTITDNRATDVCFPFDGCILGAGGGIYNRGTTILTNSILAGNAAWGGADCEGTLVLTGSNLIGAPTTCSTAGTPPITGDPKLGPLADNGGPTQTHALLPDSPAIDAGDDAACAAGPVSGKDQRGVSRPQGAHCDLGAFELEAGAPVVGGKNLRITTGSIDLSWDGGTTQTGYALLQYDANTSSATLIKLAGAAISYSDVSVVPGGLYCYALAATGAGNTVLGLSDLECAMAGIKTGAAAPGGFALALNKSATATLTWTAPAGGADAYLLQRLPLDGSPATQVTLPGSATSSTQAVPVAGGCFQLVAYQGGAWGSTDALCGIPGFSTVGKPAGGRVQSVGETMGDIRQRLLAVAAPIVKQ